MLRLELNHSLMHYYSELDAVMLCGVHQRPSTCQEYSDLRLQVIGQTPTDHAVWSPEGKGGEFSCCCQYPKGSKKEGETTCVCGRTPAENSLVQELVDLHISSSSCTDAQFNHFEALPGEVIVIILAYLDIISLSRVAQTCKLLQKHAYDCLLYTEFNLQPVCHLVTDQALDSLTERCERLQRLNLSWCGTDQSIHFDTFHRISWQVRENTIHLDALQRFLKNCTATLTCLQVSCCSFINQEAIAVIATICTQLKELDVSSCQEVNNVTAIGLIQLHHLERLNLYRTKIDTNTVVVLARSMPELQHLNLGSCHMIRNMGEVLSALGESCQKLRSLDLWRAHNIDDSLFQQFVRSCPLLEELDLGWCTDLTSRSGSFTCISENCKNLKKLYLTAIRSVCDVDLLSLAKHNKYLQQLDILGTREVSNQASEKLLSSCKDMVMFDISFCAGISNEDVLRWNEKFPNCDVKKSFQNNN